LQFLHVHGLQRHPAWVQLQVQAGAVFSIFFISILLLSSSGRIPYDLRTMVRNQGKSSDTIGGLASAAGVGVETVRYYQRRGLLPQPARPPGEIRRYGDADLKRLRFIRSAQAAGFTLSEIKELLDLDAADDRARARELARSRVRALEGKIAELQQAREALAALADACANRRGGACPILSAFDQPAAAGRKRIEVKA
jgi:MerR family mercuric resistance operon transcriptional regulator